MRAVIQRVAHARVAIENANDVSIGKGLLVFLGIEENDNAEDIEWLSKKIINLRIFPDANDLMNLCVQDVHGDVLIVSQFTLYASTRKGNRPSFIRSAKPSIAIPLYEKFIAATEMLLQKKIYTGEFGAMMQVSLLNSGPVTIIIDTKNRE